MCDKAVGNYPHALEFVLQCYKTQKMGDKAVDTYPSIIEYVADQFITQKMCDKAANSCILYLIIFLINIKLTKCVIKFFLMTFLS